MELGNKYILSSIVLFLVCLLIELAPQRDLGLQPSNSWHTRESIWSVSLFIYNCHFMVIPLAASSGTVPMRQQLSNQGALSSMSIGFSVNRLYPVCVLVGIYNMYI